MPAVGEARPSRLRLLMPAGPMPLLALFFGASEVGTYLSTTSPAPRRQAPLLLPTRLSAPHNYDCSSTACACVCRGTHIRPPCSPQTAQEGRPRRRTATAKGSRFSCRRGAACRALFPLLLKIWISVRGAHDPATIICSTNVQRCGCSRPPTGMAR